MNAPAETYETSDRFLELEQLSRGDLEDVFRRGTMPEESELAGWEFRGTNVPGWAKALGIKKFCKGFYLDQGQLRGYNTPVEQNSLSEPWLVKPNEDKPKRFGFYLVEPVSASSRDNAYLNAVLLDYGRGNNPRFDPSRGLRDYLTRVDENTYLGKAYYAVGRQRIPTNFFVLSRWRKGITRL